MPIPDDFFDSRTDKLIENLKGDESLVHSLPESVQVLKGPPRLSTAKFAIYVYRGRSEYTYTQGEQQIDADGIWTIACATRQAFDPALLEEYVSIMAAIVVRNIAAHQQEADLWLTITPGPHDPRTIRDRNNQYWELEEIPVMMTFDEELV